MKFPLRSRLFTLCADDFGQSVPINEAIIDLVRVHRLGAISVMSQGPAWPQGARALKEYQHVADIGLHLNLTHHFAKSPSIRPLLWWLLAAPRGWVNREAIRAAFQSQIDAFEQHFGRLPDYLDGHQHVHAFPVIRDALTDVIAANWQGQPQPWVRAPDCLVDAGRVPLKAWILKNATCGFADHLQQAGLRYTKRFGGLYALTPMANFPELMRRWLHELPSGTLLMVHPGKPTMIPGDSIATARAVEYDYLHNRGLSDDALSADASFVRFADLPA
jgi:predicted glycoside hydrolase/deacetylase ChbG (UPF0249 family)